MQAQEKKEYLKFLIDKKELLNVLGINVQAPTAGSIDQRWDSVRM